VDVIAQEISIAASSHDLEMDNMICPLSNELLYEIANHLDFLDIIRDATITSSIAAKERWNTILNASLASKRFCQIFSPLLRPVIFSDATVRRHEKLIRKYLEHPDEARHIRALSNIACALPSDNVYVSLEMYASYSEHVTRLSLPYRIRALGTITTLLPNLEAIQLGIDTLFSLAYRGFLQLCIMALSDERLLPKLKIVTICHTSRVQHGFDPRGIEYLLELPTVEELNVSGAYNDRKQLQIVGSVFVDFKPGMSNLKVLRLYSCDINRTFFSKLIGSIQRLEEFTLQWSSQCCGNAKFSLEQYLPVLDTHRASLRRITLDGSISKDLEEPSKLLLPIGTLTRFEALEYLDVPAVAFTGKRAVTELPGDLQLFRYRFFQNCALEQWIAKCRKGEPEEELEEQSGEEEEDDNSLQVEEGEDESDNEPQNSADERRAAFDWDFLTDIFPKSLETLVLQCPKEPEDLGKLLDWLTWFIPNKMHALPKLRYVNLSGWKHTYVDAMVTACGPEMVYNTFDGAKKVLKVPVDYVFQVQYLHRPRLGFWRLVDAMPPRSPISVPSDIRHHSLPVAGVTL
jgi:hypothetical protein